MRLHARRFASQLPILRFCLPRYWSITICQFEPWRALIFALSIAFAVSACSSEKPAFKNTDITGASYAKAFALTDHNGARRTLADFKGKVTTVFFGFTHCPDVCPTTLADMKAVLGALGPAAKDVRVLFITVDPERDTADLLKRYVSAFDAEFVGLFGTAEETVAVAKDFKVFFQKVPSRTDPKQYSIDHTAGTYVFDRAGQIRLFVRPGQGIDSLINDIKLLLNEKR
jgi:protein SCO1